MSNSTKTHWKKTQNPNYLGTYAIDPDSDLVLTIKDAKQEMISNPKGEDEEKLVLYFKEDQKPLIMNVTNSKQIEKIYGTPYIEEWIGKKIQLYIDDNIKAFGETVTGVRIRPKKPKKPKLSPSHDKWAGAVSAFGNDKTDLDTIRKHYRLDEEMEELLIEDAKEVK